MQIKNVENFNLQDCDNYLKNNQNGELVESVRLRQKQLIDQTNQVNQKKDEDIQIQKNLLKNQSQNIAHYQKSL